MDIREFLSNNRIQLRSNKHEGYVCPRCKHVFPRKSKLERHMSRKKPCVEKETTVCVYCTRTLEGMDHKQVTNHTYYCRRKHGGTPVIDEENDGLESQISQLQQNMRTLQEQIAKTTSSSIAQASITHHNTQNITNHNNYNITINVFPTPNKYGVYPNLAHSLEGCISLLQDSTTGSYDSKSLTDMLHRVVSNHLGQQQNGYIKRDDAGQYQVIRDKSKGFEATQPKEVKHVMGQCAYNTIDEVIGAEEMSPGMLPREILSEQNQGMREMRDSRGFIMTDEFENKFDTIVS